MIQDQMIRQQQPVAMAAEGETASYEDLRELKRMWQQYHAAKAQEINEHLEAWRYYHGAQYSTTQLAALAGRGQPAIVFNRTSRKINGTVGVLSRMRADPKAFPRSPKHEAGAELCTSVLRYVLDQQRWEDNEPLAVINAATCGIAVVELGLEEGDITLDIVEPSTFFYDPRSVRHDFSDARYMGVSRRISRDELLEMFPDQQDNIGIGESEESTIEDAEREKNWTESRNKHRLVEIWYRKNRQWNYCIYCNNTKLAEGESPFVDEKKKSACRYIAFSYAIDHEGDRYGMARSLKGPQDAMNQHRSKAMHIMNTRQVIMEEGAVADIEVTRQQAARPDGVIVVNPGYVQNGAFRIEQPDQEFLQQTQYFQDAKDEIENYGPNPALVGTGVNQQSGRAFAMMQQAGLSELGPFLGHLRAWKLKVYRFVMANVQKHWNSEKWIMVTDDDGLAQYLAVNAVEVNEYGQPVLVNAIGEIDVDVILDEGPDTTNVMGDVYDALLALGQSKFPIPPAAIIEAAPIPKSQKDKIMKLMSQPDPMAQQAAQVEMAQKVADVENTQADTQKKLVDAGVQQFKAQADTTLKMQAQQQQAQQPQNYA